MTTCWSTARCVCLHARVCVCPSVVLYLCKHMRVCVPLWHPYRQKLVHGAPTSAHHRCAHPPTQIESAYTELKGVIGNFRPDIILPQAEQAEVDAVLEAEAQARAKQPVLVSRGQRLGAALRRPTHCTSAGGLGRRRTGGLHSCWFLAGGRVQAASCRAHFDEEPATVIVLDAQRTHNCHVHHHYQQQQKHCVQTRCWSAQPAAVCSASACESQFSSCFFSVDHGKMRATGPHVLRCWSAPLAARA